MEERKMILKMIDEGKISAEDGEKLMRAISNNSSNTEPTVSSSTTRDKSQLSTEVNWEEGNRRFDEQSDQNVNQDDNNRWSEGARWFSDFVESAVTKIKELDLDFNFGNAVEVNHIFQHTGMSEDLFNLSLENGAVELKTWDEPDVKLECTAKVYKASHVEEARNSFLENTVFESIDNELHFYTKSKRIKLNTTVYLPKKKLEKVKLYTFNGKVTVADADTTYLSIKSVNGSLDVDSVKTELLEAEALNGTVHVKGGTIDRIDLRTANGSVELDGSYKDIDAEALNGTIHCHFKDVKTGYASLNAGTGSVKVIVPDQVSTKAKLKTNVGSYHWKLPNVDVHEEKRDFIQKTLTLVSNPNFEDQIRIDASTKTGSISIKTESEE
ncbi:DUF4097 family beta strand repeat-containing protein [Geomicrobium sediminis]|uniref:DUF4097 and DUF4098 domain-containing protein YvlB n=1 Tax=Geomicrobium sediminis TaxID=1347788 RepID=A0ABS2P781_9BACL|nr:DUF4097 domain-containing protein [Geomicrobium sediminis]MBM7631254.1 DUF4097 and DUF4098 domain-containing protein YvlB [Geomicrobium sediminis]